ncbi:DUF4071 domain-containing protein [Mycoplasmatota bacterium]|nr:DUF4071 domain-containing protein [Mycoplasmatota bacterium]
MVNKICFVIMGFHEKTDYESGKTFDLDKTYENIIKPVVEECGYTCIRADEVYDSGIIDKSMYTLLYRAELVIADISTYNPNAVYELGIRHALRPFSTIVMKESSGRIPFDLNHTRTFIYKHLGKDIGFSEVDRCRRDLEALIQKVETAKEIDSPLYEYLSELSPPIIPEHQYEKLIASLSEKENELYAIKENAMLYRRKSNFIQASKEWEKALKLKPDDTYFIQQLALCTYKSESPSVLAALIESKAIISKILPNSNDPETMGIAGAIHKNLYYETVDNQFLDLAINYYKKGFSIRVDYYNGENYALCCDVKSSISDGKEKIYYSIEADKVRNTIIENLLNLVSGEIKQLPDEMWVYATLSNCYFAIGNKDKYLKYKLEFEERVEEKWQLESFNNSLKQLKNIRKPSITL